MRLHLYSALIGFSLLVSTVVSAQAEAPLMVIRFNQPNVYYQKPLYNAVSQALEAKPDAQFDVVGISTGRNAAQAERNLRQVVGTLNEIGLPTSRYSVSRRTSGNVESNEVHIFAH